MGPNIQKIASSLSRRPIAGPAERLAISRSRDLDEFALVHSFVIIGLGTRDNGTIGVLPFRPRGHKFPRQDSNLHLPLMRRSNRSLHHRPSLFTSQIRWGTLEESRLE